MNYCSDCSIVFNESRCPACNSKDIRMVHEEDFCFLTKKDPIWSSMVEDILKQNNIAYTTKAEMGTAFAMKIAPANERYSFFVPFALLEQAKELMNEVFNSKQEET